MTAAPSVPADAGTFGQKILAHLATALEPSTGRVRDTGGHVYNALNAGYSITGLGSSSETTAVNALIDTAFDDGGGDILFPRAAYRFDTPVTCKSGVRLHFAAGAEIIKGANTNLFEAEGTAATAAALDKDVDAGTWTVTLPSGVGASFATGDLLAIEADNVVFSTDCKPREIRRVLEVSGDVVTLDKPCVWDYTVANDAMYFKVTPITDVLIEGGFWHALTAATPETGYLFFSDWAYGIAIVDLYGDIPGGGIHLKNTVSAHVRSPRLEHLTYNAPWGYGVFTGAASADILVTDMRWRDGRHAFTTTNDGLGHFAQDIIVKGGIGSCGPSGLAIWDTHEYSYNVLFDTLIANGSGAQPAFQTRCPKMKLANCVGKYGSRGVSIAVATADLEILGGEFAFNAAQGITSGAHSNVRVNGANVHDNGSIGVFIGASSTDFEVRNCRITNNGTAGVQDGGGTRPVVQGNVIPWSATQFYGVFNLGATGIAKDNIFPGSYGGTGGSNALREANAAAVKRGNIGYRTNTKTWDPGSIADGDSATTTVTVTKAALGDFVIVTFSLSLAGLHLSAYVSAADTVTVVLSNDTGSAVDLGSGTLKVVVETL